MKRLSVQKTGANLKELRKQNGFSLANVASALCVTTEAVKKWERGQTLPSIEHLAELAEFYGCSIEDLLVFEDG